MRLPAAENWYEDPTKRHELRYWSGQQWTEHVVTAGHQTIDETWPAVQEANTSLHWIKQLTWQEWDWPENAIRGESFRQDKIQRIQGLTDSPDEVRLDPVVVQFRRRPDHDMDTAACMALVAGSHVGYLAAEYAAELAPIVDAADIETWKVAGAVVGGTEGAPSFGVHVWLGQRLTRGPRKPTVQLRSRRVLA